MTDQAKQWKRKINYVAKEDGDRYPKKHSYEFTTLDTVKDEHKEAVAMLDACDTEDGQAALKDIGEKSIDTIAGMVVYSLVCIGPDYSSRPLPGGGVSIATTKHVLMPEVADLIARVKNSG